MTKSGEMGKGKRKVTRGNINDERGDGERKRGKNKTEHEGRELVRKGRLR